MMMAGSTLVKFYAHMCSQKKARRRLKIRTNAFGFSLDVMIAFQQSDGSSLSHPVPVAGPRDINFEKMACVRIIFVRSSVRLKTIELDGQQTSRISKVFKIIFKLF
jgi:hypothetical protein